MSEVYLISSAATGNASTGPDATVFHVDTDPTVRHCVEEVAGAMRLDYVGHNTSKSFLDDFDINRPGCLVLEVNLPHVSGLQIQAFVRSESSPLPVVFLSADAEHETIIRAMKAGAFQFLRKPTSEQDLWDTLQAAVHFDRRCRSRLAEQDQLRRRLAMLDPKEREVLFLTLEHDSTQDIAEVLSVSVRTVELRRARILQKLGLHSLRELLCFAFAVSQIVAERTGSAVRFRANYPPLFPGAPPVMPSSAGRKHSDGSS